MIDQKTEYALFCDKYGSRGLDIEGVKEKLKQQKIETPSWGYANSGTRFKTFPWPGAATTTRQKLDDAAMVHKMTGIAPSVALHIPWDKPEDGDYKAMRHYAKNLGIQLGAINPNVFQDDIYRLGSFCNPHPAVREQALNHMADCCEIMQNTGSDILSLWFADGTNYAGQDSLRERKHRMQESLAQVYLMLPERSRMLLEYKFFEPAFYSTDVPDWGVSYALCLKLGPKAQTLVDLGHHAQGVNIEQIVAFLIDENKLGGFHFNNRKYADDDLIVGSVNPYELFLIYNELADAELSNDEMIRTCANNIAYMIDQSFTIEGKIAPMIQSVLNCQTAYAKALLVNRTELAAARRSGDVLAAHNILNEAYQIDVSPLLFKVREELNCPANPIAAYRESKYEENISAERGKVDAGSGYQ